MKRIFLYFHTLRYLKWKQIFYRVLYSLKRRSLPATGRGARLPSADLHDCPKLLSPFLSAAPYYSQGVFTFLNCSKSFSGPVDWTFAGHGKLWTYQLNSFDFLNQPEMTAEEGLELIRSFLASMDRNQVGMEPYPISLRGMNWIKFLSRWGILDKAVDVSLYRQYCHLLYNLEYHLLGNHLLENGFSLLFGAYYFGDKRFYRKAADILRMELAEQILPDGGHFELSPMYHQIMLYRVLDCINLIKSNHHIFNNDLIDLLVEKGRKMLGWLNAIVFENGDIPLVNDSANGIAPTTRQLNEYAASLGLLDNSRSVHCILGESGYRKIRQGKYEAVLDVGNIGPDYIPGHAHSDTFSFEMYLKGRPLIVDTGISTYETDPVRLSERSTRAHNTVQLDEYEQSEVWGSFRVARRAKVVELHEDQGEIRATHDGYHRLGAMHTRSFRPEINGIFINDKVEATKNFRCNSYLHFCPGIPIRIEGHDVEAAGVRISFKGARRVTLQDFHYAPEFNRRIASKMVVAEFTGNLATEILL